MSNKVPPSPLEIISTTPYNQIPEFALWNAIIMSAIADIRNEKRSKRLARNARWFFKGALFKNILTILGFDVTFVIKRLESAYRIQI